MRIRNWLVGLFAALLMAGVFSACGSPPEEEIMAAEDAIKAAVEAGAEDSSPKLLEKARINLQEAKQLSEQGHYNEARKKADFAALRAEEAQKNAERLGGAAEHKPEAED